MPDTTDSDLVTTPETFLGWLGITGATPAELVAAQRYAKVMPHRMGVEGVCTVCGLHDVEVEDAPMELACLGRWVAADAGGNPSLVGAESPPQ